MQWGTLLLGIGLGVVLTVLMLFVAYAISEELKR